MNETMPARHNYTNEAFCQQSEFDNFSCSSKLTTSEAKPDRKYAKNWLNEFPTSTYEEVNHNANREVCNKKIPPEYLCFREDSECSFNKLTASSVNKLNNTSLTLFEKDIPKTITDPHLVLSLKNTHANLIPRKLGSGCFTMVSIDELSKKKLQTSLTQQRNSFNSSHSQENIDEYLQFMPDYNNSNTLDVSERFITLAPMSQAEQPSLITSLSRNLNDSSIILVDHKSNKKFSIVPTAENEIIVDDNKEIIQMYNGKTHRYAVIPTEDYEENDSFLSNKNENQPYTIIENSTEKKIRQSLKPQIRKETKQTSDFNQKMHSSQQTQCSYFSTPKKNHEATRKLHEILSTPNKEKHLFSNQKLNNFSPSESNKNIKSCSSDLYNDGNDKNNSFDQNNDYLPRILQYGSQVESLRKNAKMNIKPLLKNEPRNTAIIIQSLDHANNCADFSEINCEKSTMNPAYSQKLANAIATLGVVSLMLILSSIMGSGVCLYLIAMNGKTFYLEFSLAASFLGVGLGILGFRSRYSEWLPNRSYISGYILVTVFCLIKCCGLLVLLALDPIPGDPLHDVTTGVILGLSTFELFFIGLGIIGSWWCYRPPPDNRVNVF